MNYIVWDLISDYDGYSQTECVTWDEVVACVRAACKENKKALAQFEKWREGKIAEIRVVGKGSGNTQATEVNVFVTSKKLTEPQE